MRLVKKFGRTSYLEIVNKNVKAGSFTTEVESEMIDTKRLEEQGKIQNNIEIIKSDENVKVIDENQYWSEIIYLNDKS